MHRPAPAHRDRPADPPLPDDVTGHELDKEVRSELLTLSKDGAVAVSRHLVLAGRLIDEDPEAAYRHAMAAQRRAGRVGVVREAAGLAAYRTGRYEEALRELRAARRLTGSDEHWPVMADCERGLGRPERALAMASAPETRGLDAQARLEMRMVVAGARSDLGQHDAAVLVLQVPELTAGTTPDVRARLQSAYADALEAAGRTDEARTWLERAAATDPDGSTGAAERLGLEPADGDDELWDLLEDGDEAGGEGGGTPPR